PHHVVPGGAHLLLGHGVGSTGDAQVSDGPDTGARNQGKGGTTMRHTWGLTRVLAPMLALLFILGTVGVAFAHGERAQEGFLRMKTVAWQDVRFSATSVKQGEQLIITGKVKVLEPWPATLEKPVQAYLNVSASGPHLVMKERYVNGAPAPAAIFVEVGGVYEFKMVLDGRTPGYWHVHPTFFVLHTGGLLGPGQWTTVTEVPGGYQNKVTLLDGKVINLDTYASGWVFWFSFLGFIPGVWWIPPPQLPEPVKFAQVKGLGAIYDPKKDTLILESQVTNTGNQPMKLVGFTTSNLTFSEGKGLVAEPATVDPGRTVKLKMTIQDRVWSDERLIPLDKPQMGVAGLLVFESGGKQNAVTTEAHVRPTSFR